MEQENTPLMTVFNRTDLKIKTNGSDETRSEKTT